MLPAGRSAQASLRLLGSKVLNKFMSYVVFLYFIWLLLYLFMFFISLKFVNEKVDFITSYIFAEFIFSPHFFWAN